MYSWKVWIILIVVFAAAGVPLLATIDAALGRGQGASGQYFLDRRPIGTLPAIGCRPTEGVKAARLASQGVHYAFLGPRDDTLIYGPNSPLTLADIGSGRTGKAHDLLVLMGVAPEALDISRVGAHLLFCGRQVAIELIILRQYCRDTSPESAWNNEYEEIAFPESREIWLADDLYAEWNGNHDLLAITGLHSFPEWKPLLRKDPAAWKVRAFSETLPGDWFAPFACRFSL